MESYYTLDNTITLKVVHENDALFTWLDDEIKYYRSDKKSECDCFLSLRPNSKKIGIPDKALFSSTDTRGRWTYTKGDTVYIHKDKKYTISVDYGNKKVTAEYTKPTKEIYEILRGMVKWGFIRSAEQKGLVYIHSSAVHYKNKNIVFSADTNNGKSSSAMRLLGAGATLITDDSILIDGENLIPFTFKTAVDTDFAKRFKIKPTNLDVGRHMDQAKKYKHIDIVVFLHIWNSKKSEMRALPYEQALLKMIRIYKKEDRITAWHNWDKNAAAHSKLIFKKYAEILQGAKYFEFYAGSNENEVKKTLFNSIHKIIT